MRKIVFTTLLVASILNLKAQSILENVNTKPLLFESFLNGTVLMKSGSVESAPLNYNTDNQNIVFIQDAKYLVLDDLDKVDTIYLQQKKFIPVNNKMYQLVSENGPVTLLVSYTNRNHPMMTTTDHNGSSKQSMSQVSNTVTEVYATKLYKGNYSVEILRHYWFKKNDKLYKVSPKKQFVSSFTSKARTAVEKYIASENINFDYEPDLVKLVAYCNKEVN